MLLTVSAPNRYVDLQRGSSRFVPVWLPASAEAIFEIPDPWSYHRLSDRKHGSLFHVTLPDALELPGIRDDMPFGVIRGTSTYFELDDHLPFTGTDIVRYDIYVSAVFEGLVGVYVITLENRISTQRHRWAGEYRAQFVTVSKDQGATAVTQWYLSPSWSFNRIFQETVTVRDVIDWTLAQVWYDNRPVSIVYPVDIVPTDLTQDQVERLVAQRVQACLRFEEDKLVDDVIHLEHVYNPLAKKRHDTVTVTPRGSPLWVHSNEFFLQGKAEAYVNALEDIPVQSQNTLQNIAALYQVLSHFAFDAEGTADVFNRLASTQSPLNIQGLPRIASVELPEIPQHAKNAWLGGRYVFSTSVMDAGSAWDFYYDKALKAIKSRSSGYKCHGKATVEDATFSCTFHITEKNLSGALNFYDALYRTGMEPNAYVLWDFVPYSFVADWFLPIGDSLNAYVMADHYSPLYYNYDKLYGDYAFCYSVKYTVKDPILGPVQVYARWYESSPPNVNAGAFLLSGESASTKTQCWRFVDALCLIL
jgi:hypothetical protein